jgi:hypothetical protein
MKLLEPREGRPHPPASAPDARRFCSSFEHLYVQ